MGAYVVGRHEMCMRRAGLQHEQVAGAGSQVNTARALGHIIGHQGGMRACAGGLSAAQ